MKLSIFTLAGVLWGLGLGGSVAIAQQPTIPTGTYAAGDRYISVANNGERTCYQGFSDPPLENSITVGETTGSLRAQPAGMLAEGWFEYGREVAITMEGSTLKVTHSGNPVGDYAFYSQSLINEAQADALQRCLNTDQLFFATSPGYAVTSPRLQSPQALAAIDSAAPTSPLPSGVYYTEGTMNNNSRREILNRNGKLCLKSVEGPPSPYSGRETIVISSISLRDGQLYVDTTGDKFTVYDGAIPGTASNTATTVAFDDGTRRSRWALGYTGTPSQIGAALEQDEFMRACMDATDGYSHSMDGAVIYGREL